jgi:hypothetical protein
VSPQEVSVNGTKLHSSGGASPVPLPIGIAPLFAVPGGKWMMLASAVLEIPAASARARTNAFHEPTLAGVLHLVFISGCSSDKRRGRFQPDEVGGLWPSAQEIPNEV